MRHFGLLALLVAACAPDGASAPVVDSGAYHHYLQISWHMPETPAEAQAFALDLDADAAARPDNAFGAVLATLAGQGLDAQTASDVAFARGDLILLHSLRADDLADDDSVSWRVLRGASARPPLYNGTDELTVTDDAGELVGHVERGALSAAHGDLTIALPLFAGQDPIPVPLTAARVEVTMLAGGCTGRVGGAIFAETMTDRVLPMLATQLAADVALHPDTQLARFARSAFDENADGTLTPAEIQASPIVAALLAPDVDLDGDGTRDALSLGLGFDCVSARFEAPGEE